MKRKNKSKYIDSLIWSIAVILEWVNIGLFLLAMGYNFDIELYQKITIYRYIAEIYYVSAAVDIFLFFVLAIKNRIVYNPKNILLSVYCGVVQIVLLIAKVKW